MEPVLIQGDHRQNIFGRRTLILETFLESYNKSINERSIRHLSLLFSLSLNRFCLVMNSLTRFTWSTSFRTSRPLGVVLLMSLYRGFQVPAPTTGYYGCFNFSTNSFRTKFDEYLKTFWLVQLTSRFLNDFYDEIAARDSWFSRNRLSHILSSGDQGREFQ